jgi:hypothetical protein
MVAAGNSGAGLSRVRRIAGDTLSPQWTVYASGGALSSTQPSPSFALHDPLTLDVDGDGAEEVVVGSDDGWLYAIHAADGTLLLSINLGAPVSHLIAADVDLDPQTELVASLGDGRLVAIDDTDKYLAVRDGADAGAGDGGIDAAAPPDASDGGGPDAANAKDATVSPMTDAGVPNDAAASGDGSSATCVPTTHTTATQGGCAVGHGGSGRGTGPGEVLLGGLLAGVLFRRRRRRTELR